MHITRHNMVFTWRMLGPVQAGPNGRVARPAQTAESALGRCLEPPAGALEPCS
jgi:hypothetical protein